VGFRGNGEVEGDDGELGWLAAMLWLMVGVYVIWGICILAFMLLNLASELLELVRDPLVTIVAALAVATGLGLIVWRLFTGIVVESVEPATSTGKPSRGRVRRV